MLYRFFFSIFFFFFLVLPVRLDRCSVTVTKHRSNLVSSIMDSTTLKDPNLFDRDSSPGESISILYRSSSKEVVSDSRFDMIWLISRLFISSNLFPTLYPPPTHPKEKSIKSSYCHAHDLAYDGFSLIRAYAITGLYLQTCRRLFQSVVQCSSSRGVRRRNSILVGESIRSFDCFSLPARETNFVSRIDC